MLPKYHVVLKCADEKEARRLSDAICALDDSRGLAKKTQDLGDSGRVEIVEVELNHYLPPELLELADDAGVTPLGSLQVPDRLMAIAKAFLDVFGNARIVKIEPALRKFRQVRGAEIAVSVAMSDWEPKRAAMMEAHAELIVWTAGLVNAATREPLVIVSVDGGAKEIRASIDDKEIPMSGAQARALAALLLLSTGGWFSASDFCTFHYGEEQPEADAAFDSAMRQLRKAIPALRWASDHKGNRKIHGVILRTSISPANIRKLIRHLRGKKGKRIQVPQRVRKKSE